MFARAPRPARLDQRRPAACAGGRPPRPSLGLGRPLDREGTHRSGPEGRRRGDPIAQGRVRRRGVLRPAGGHRLADLVEVGGQRGHDRVRIALLERREDRRVELGRPGQVGARPDDGQVRP